MFVTKINHSRKFLCGPAAVARFRRAFSTPAFQYQELFDLAPDEKTPYKKLTGDHVSTIEVNGMKFLKVEPEALRILSAQAMIDIAHLLRPAHLQSLSNMVVPAV